MWLNFQKVTLGQTQPPWASLLRSIEWAWVETGNWGVWGETRPPRRPLGYQPSPLTYLDLSSNPFSPSILSIPHSISVRKSRGVMMLLWQMKKLSPGAKTTAAESSEPATRETRSPAYKASLAPAPRVSAAGLGSAPCLLPPGRPSCRALEAQTQKADPSGAPVQSGRHLESIWAKAELQGSCK